jgi:hypothetical protein
MNEALTLYENERKIAYISGYTYRNTIKENCFFMRLPSSWGWATWAHAWNDSTFDTTFLCTQFNTQKKISKFNFGNYDFYALLKSQEMGKVDSWSIRYYASFFLKQKVCLFPNKSLVRNIGFGNEATHTSMSDSFYISECADFIKLSKIDVSINKKHKKNLEKYFKQRFVKQQSLLQKLMIRIKEKMFLLFKRYITKTI